MTNGMGIKKQSCVNDQKIESKLYAQVEQRRQVLDAVFLNAKYLICFIQKNDEHINKSLYDQIAKNDLEILHSLWQTYYEDKTKYTAHVQKLISGSIAEDTKRFYLQRMDFVDSNYEKTNKEKNEIEHKLNTIINEKTKK